MPKPHVIVRQARLSSSAVRSLRAYDNDDNDNNVTADGELAGTIAQHDCTEHVRAANQRRLAFVGPMHFRMTMVEP